MGTDNSPTRTAGSPFGEQPTHASAQRLAWLDGLKLLGVVLVVVQHACTTSWMAEAGITSGAKALLGITFAGVPLLLVAAGYASTLARGFGMRRAVDLKRRAVRIGIPYLAWTLVFFFAQRYLPYGEGVGGLTIVSLLTGSDIYVVLWFLPMLFYVSAVGWTIKAPRARLAASLVALVVFVWLALVDPVADSLWVGFGIYLLSMSRWGLMFLLGQCAAYIPVRHWTGMQRGVAWGVAALAAVGAAWLTRDYPDLTLLQEVTRQLFTIALAVTLLFLARGAAWPRRPLQLAAVTLGIYMMHLPLLSLLGRLVPSGVVPWFIWVPANAALVVLAAGAVGLLLSRTKLSFLVC